MVLVQIFLGVGTLLYQVPMALGALHQAGAFTLLALITRLRFLSIRGAAA